MLHAIGAGTLPLPPAVKTLGIEPGEAEPGQVTFHLDVGEYHLNPFGIVHGGVLAAMLDTAMGCAVHSLLPAAVGYVTGEMNVRFLRPALLSGGALVCTGEVVNQGRTTMVATARDRRRAGADHRDRRRHLPGSQTMMSLQAATVHRAAKGGTLILGGGFGGAHLARRLGSATIISPDSSMLFTPLLAEVAAGAIEPRHVMVPLRMMCPQADLVRGRASGLDQTARTVTVETDAGPVAVSYRRLVIAVGSAPRLLPIPGLAQHAMTFKGVADAIRLRNHVLRMLDRADADQRNPGRWLSFVFVGAGIRRRRSHRRDETARPGCAPALPGAARRPPTLGPHRRRSQHPSGSAAPARSLHSMRISGAKEWRSSPPLRSGLSRQER